MSTSATGRLPGVARRVNRPKPLVFPFPQFRKHLIGAALRKSMLRRELQSSCGVRFNGCAWLYNETTFPIGHFLPDNGLTWLKIHLATKLGRVDTWPRSVILVFKILLRAGLRERP